MSLLTAATTAQMPIAAVVDLDSSIVVQLAVFLLFFYLFNKILIQPMLSVFERRHSLTDGAREEARVSVKEAEAKIAEYEERIAAARRSALEESKSIRAAASQKERELIDAQKATSQATVEKGLAGIQQVYEAASAQLEEEAKKTAEHIVERIVGGAA